MNESDEIGSHRFCLVGLSLGSCRLACFLHNAMLTQEQKLKRSTLPL